MAVTKTHPIKSTLKAAMDNSTHFGKRERTLRFYRELIVL